METIKDKVKIQKYFDLKQTGVDWLGAIPKHWQLLPGYAFLKERSEKNTGMKESQVLSLSYGNVVVKSEQKLTGLVPESFETYQLVYPDDIIIRPTDLQNDKTSLRTGLAKNKGIITSAYMNLSVIGSNSNKYYYYLLHSIDTNKVIYGLGSGLRQNLSYDDFKRFLFPVPLPEEQTAIAEFLDRKTTQIDQAIEIKEKQIELLKERRQILIQNAVTKGLDPNVKMKKSGVEWIGDIPAHWSIIKLRQFLEPVSVKNKPELQLLSITREYGIIVRDVDDLESNHNFIPDDLSGYKVIKQGQFGMNKMKAWQGSYGVSKHTGLVSPAYYVFDLITNINPDFFHLALRSSLYVSFFGAASDGVRIGQWDLNKSRMKEIPLVIPAKDEQQEIVELISIENAKTSNSIADLKTQIQKLEEYKTTIINSTVTGKIKVV